MAMKHDLSPYRNQYLIYARKSTDDTDNQKNSIDYQKAEGLKFAKLRHLPIADFDLLNFSQTGIISEKHSGFKEDQNFIINSNGMIQYKIERPKFQKLVQLLHQGMFKGIIFLCWDRASRNRTDDNILRKLMDRGLDIHFVQATYDKTSSGELHMDIDGMFSNHYSRVIREKVTNTIEKLRREGICTYRAPVGYLNLGDPRNKPFDPIRAPIIKRIFEKYSEGNISLQDLARWANNQGLTMTPMRKRRTQMEKEEETEIEAVARPLTFKNIQKILTNRFYTGQIIGWNGQWVSSISHKALISTDIFSKVQTALNSKRTSVSYDKKLMYPYRGVFRCGCCMRVYTPYMRKGIIYYGARCDHECQNSTRSFNKIGLECKIGETMATMYYSDSQIEILRQAENDYSAHQVQRIKDIEAKERQITKIRDDLTFLKDNKLTLIKSGAYTPEDYCNEESRLISQLQTLQKSDEQVDSKEVLKNVLQFSELSKRINLTYHLSKSPQKEEIMSKMFSELKLSENNLQFKGRNGFRIFESPFMAMCDPTGWFSELIANKNLIESSIAELNVMLNKSSR